LSLEDETGISNVVIMPDVFDQQRLDIVGYPWVMVEGADSECRQRDSYSGAADIGAGVSD